MASISFLIVSADKEEKYLICDKEFTKWEKSNSFTPAGWDAFNPSGGGGEGKNPPPPPYQIFSLYKRRN